MDFKNAIKEDEAAEYVGLSESTLRNARLYGSEKTRIPTPPFIKLGRSIRYRICDLDAWLEQNISDQLA